MRLTGFVFGVAIGATLMYMFDPRQGPERREVWGERVRRGRDQAQHAVEEGRHRVDEFRHQAEDVQGHTQSTVDGMREQVSTYTADGDDSDL